MLKKLCGIALLSTILLSSCGIHEPLTTNANHHGTQVILSKNNFEVLKPVSAEASATYILGFGGFNKRALIASAKQKLIYDANLYGSSKALINETVEMKTDFYLFVLKRHVTVSAQVIEFNDK